MYNFIDTQYPLCNSHCSELSEILRDCLPEFSAALQSDAEVLGQLEELLTFVVQLNCTNPSSYLVPSMSVDVDECLPLTNFCKI